MLSLARLYWKPLLMLAIALSILGYVGVLKSKIKSLQRDNASLQAMIDLSKAIGLAQNEKTARIEQGAHLASIASAKQYLSDLEKVKKYNATHPSIVRIPNSMRQPATNPHSCAVSETGASANRVDASAADEISGGSSLEQDCRITTLMLLRLQDFEREQQAIK